MGIRTIHNTVWMLLANLTTAFAFAAYAVGPSATPDGKGAVKLFHDYCVLKRWNPDHFAVSMEGLGIRLAENEADSFMMGEVGGAWRMRGADYVFTITPLSRCRLHVLSKQEGGTLKAFIEMASNPPAGIASREIPIRGASSLSKFVWSEGKEHREDGWQTELLLRPGSGQGLDPPDSHWIFSAEDYIDDPVLIFDNSP